MKTKEINITNFKEGDRKTYYQIFDIWYDSLCMFSNKFINDLQSSEDIVQESFISLWNNRDTIESPSHLKAFLYQVTRNNSLNHLKHQKIKDEHHTEIISQLSTDNHFINFVIEEETERLLLQTEKELAPKCKEIFLLSIKGQTNNEIADKLGISVNTVKTQKKIAYKVLKTKLSEVVLIISLLAQ